MECSNIQEKLSIYIEDIISSEEKVLIDEHLKSCQRCNSYLTDLRKTIEYVKNLEEIEPPSWLTQKVMMRVISEAEPKKGILQRLFYPLHIKLPLEVAATITIAIATIYVLKTIQPEMKLVTPTEIPKGEIASPLARKDIFTKPAEQPMPAKEPDALENKRLPEAPSPAKKQEEAMQYAGSLAKEEVKREVSSPATKLKAAMFERKIDSISLTLNVKDLETASKEIEKHVKELGGKITKTEYSENKNVLIAEIVSNKLKELFEKLKLIGEVNEKEVELKASEGSIEIRIEITGI